MKIHQREKELERIWFCNEIMMKILQGKSKNTFPLKKGNFY